MSYFKDNYEHFRYPLEADGYPGFRAAQLGAIHAVAGHFAQRSDPAIVTMPTGSGKTGVMIACSFVLRAHRVLVVTPSRLVREQIADEMARQTLLIRLTALPNDIPRPKVSSVGERVTTPERWRGLREYDVVVGTVQSISPALDDIVHPAPDQFDLVMFDEAHHSSARTWQTLLDSFPDSRRLLFTATPFRRDRREIHGRFVFTYDLKQAHDDGVFGQIRYRAVEERGDERTRDIAVAHATRAQFRADRAAGFVHLVMVRTDRKTRARELASIYEEHTDLRLVSLNSDHSLRHAKSVIGRLRQGTLDGIISVNMLGEGFDLPRLKIAAVHAPHKSLAATLQFIGRFARTAGENLGTATFLAVPDDIEIERRRLFTVGAAWQELVENLNAEQVEREANLREVLESFDQPHLPVADLGDLSLYSLEPYHHVKIYRSSGRIDLSTELEFPEDTIVAYRSVSLDHATAVWITRERSAVRWSRDGKVVDVNHNLFVVYHDEESRLLFICSSIRTQGMYEEIGEQLMEGEPRILPLARINRALNGVSDLEFFNVGMRNRIQGNQTESYRIITGPSAGQAILPGDARLFHRGHCYGRGETGEGSVTIGLSSASKVWSNRSSQVPDLIAWCRDLARRIQDDRIPVTGGGLDHLSAGEEVDSLPPGIFCADWDYELYKHPRVVEFVEAGRGERVQLLDFDIEVERDRCTDSRVALLFRYEGVVFRANFSYDTDRLFEPASDHEVEINVDSGKKYPFIELLNQCPLCFYTEDLSLLRGFDLYSPPQGGGTPFSEEQIQVVNWEDEGVDIRREFGLGRNGRRSIHSFIQDYLEASAASVVYYDHGSGEVADYIAFTEVNGAVIVDLYHCKGSGGDEPGNRVEDAYEVCSQAGKSVIHTDPVSLADRIMGRYNRGAGESTFVKGDCDLLRGLIGSYVRSDYRFKMVIVQPGIARGDLALRISNLLAATNDYLVRGGFSSLKVMAS